MTKKDQSKSSSENNLSNWANVVRSSYEQTVERRKQWQKEIGSPLYIIETEDYKLGFWKCLEGIFTAPITCLGPDPTRVITYTIEFISILKKLLEDK